MEYPKSPKLLPYLARRSGVSESTAARLWREALTDSRRQYAPNSPECWNAALTQWRRALDERRVERSMPWLAPLMQAQRRLFELSLRPIELWLHWAANRTRTPG